MKNKQFWISTLFALAVTAGAIWVLKKMTAEISLEQIMASLDRVHPASVAGALLLATICYVLLTVYDWVALKTIGRPQNWKVSMSGAVAAYSLSHNLGFAPITATGARWRIYSPHGIGMADVTRIVFLTGIAFWFGVILMVGAILAIKPSLFADHLPLEIPSQWQHLAGCIVVGLFALYVGAIHLGMKKIGWKGISIPTPPAKTAAAQSLVSIAEMALASAILWMLIPGVGIADYPAVFVTYLIAFTSVLITHSPGGVGVLEAITIAMLPQVPVADTLVGLVLFRIIFHILPLIAGVVLLMKAPQTRRIAAEAAA